MEKRHAVRFGENSPLWGVRWEVLELITSMVKPLGVEVAHREWAYGHPMDLVTNRRSTQDEFGIALLLNLPLQGDCMETTETTTETTTNTPMAGSISLAEALYCTYHESERGDGLPSWTELKEAADADTTSLAAITVTTWGKVAARAYDLLSRNN